MLPEHDLAFGPFQLDVRKKRLLRGGAPVALSNQQFVLLHMLASRAGKVVAKDDLITQAWGFEASDNRLTNAMFKLRAALGAGQDRDYIKTVNRQGYRFEADVIVLEHRATQADLDAVLASHRAFLDGRAALESLERRAIARARATFGSLLADHNHEAAVHVGYAMASVLQYEMTRADPAPDVEALRQAAVHARDACFLGKNYAEAWATLGFVLERTNERADAPPALRHAITLEPNNWRHHLRLAAVSWGEERLREAERTLALLPGCPMARCLAAMVYIARGAFAEAERELDAGLIAMTAERNVHGRVSAVALCWLKGLVYLARGDEELAMACFEQELALETRGHLYGRECCANTYVAIGVCHMRRGNEPSARAAFDQALARVPAHPMARVGLALLAGQRDIDLAPAGPMSMDVVMAQAALYVADGDTPGAVAIVDAVLACAPAGNTGWRVPVEPLLNLIAAPEAWASVLVRLRSRAE